MNKAPMILLSNWSGRVMSEALRAFFHHNTIFLEKNVNWCKVKILNFCSGCFGKLIE